MRWRGWAFHAVVTSVDRDDLADGGARHFAAVIGAIRQRSPATTIEVLTPDFLRKAGAHGAGRRCPARRLQSQSRNGAGRSISRSGPGARYFHSLRLLQSVKERDPALFTKSGIMVGLGETREQVLQVMDDMRVGSVDFITIGQYLQPTRKHAAIDRFVTPDEFKAYETIAYAKGFLMVASSPLTRSSHHAGEDFARLRAARQAAAASGRAAGST